MAVLPGGCAIATADTGRVKAPQNPKQPKRGANPKGTAKPQRRRSPVANGRKSNTAKAEKK
jgi:hypothetical protein